MNAVNLIPADARKRRATVSASPITLVLIGVLVAALGAAVLYVSTVNKVTTRKAELASVNASVASWQSAASSFDSVKSTAAQRQAQLAQVRGLADNRYAWSQLLSQIGGLMPAKAALTSLQATTTSAATTSASTTSTSTPATGTAAAVPTAVLPSIQLSGCASSQSMVAETMVQLHKITNVSSVNLASSSDNATPNGGSTAGGCPFPVTFQVSLTFSAPVATATAATTSAAASTAPATTPATTTPTGAAQ